MSLDEKVIMGNVMAGHGAACWFRRENVKKSIEELKEKKFTNGCACDSCRRKGKYVVDWDDIVKVFGRGLI